MITLEFTKSNTDNFRTWNLVDLLQGLCANVLLILHCSSNPLTFNSNVLIAENKLRSMPLIVAPVVFQFTDSVLYATTDEKMLMLDPHLVMMNLWPVTKKMLHLNINFPMLRFPSHHSPSLLVTNFLISPTKMIWQLKMHEKLKIPTLREKKTMPSLSEWRWTNPITYSIYWNYVSLLVKKLNSALLKLLEALRNTESPLLQLKIIKKYNRTSMKNINFYFLTKNLSDRLNT